MLKTYVANLNPLRRNAAICAARAIQTEDQMVERAELTHAESYCKEYQRNLRAILRCAGLL
jgi:hypothetical protein